MAKQVKKETEGEAVEAKKKGLSNGCDSSFDAKMATFRFLGSIVLVALIVLLLADLFLTPPIAKWLTEKEWVEGWEEREHFLWASLSWSLVALLFVALVLLIIMRFTIVDEGTSKLVVRLGEYQETLLVKRGYKVDDDGEIVELQAGEAPPPSLPGGLRFVGFWPFDSVYIQKEFEWIKINPDNTAEDRYEENVDFILARDYVYGIRVLKAEDVDLVPLDVLLAVTAWVSNPSKAYLRNAKDWFRTLVGRVSHYPREFVAIRSYEVVQKADLENELMQKLLDDDIITEFKQRYGITIYKVEVLDINPDEKFRALTLQKRVGQMNANQAVEETAGRILKMVAAMNSMPVETPKDDQGRPIPGAPEGLKERLAANPNLRGTPSSKGGYKEDFDYARDQVKRDRAGEKGELTDIRVGNSDGTPFPEGAIIGGLAAIFGEKRKSSPRKDKSKGGEKGKKEKSPKDDDDDEDDDLRQQIQDSLDK